MLKKDQPIKFFESYPINYRAANKAFRKRATHLRDINLLTDITVNENDLKMYLKYRNKNNGTKTQYKYRIDSIFDPFDRNDEHNLKTHNSKDLNQTSLLLKPQYGSNFTKDQLSHELNTFLTYVKQDLFVKQTEANGPPNNFPEFTPTINERHILLQFETPEDTVQAKALIDMYKGKFLKGSYTDFILYI